MYTISKEIIKKELERIAFFVQHSGLFDQFPVRTREVLENLPIEWIEVETGGETQLDWQDEPTWETAKIDGKLNEKPFILKVKKDSARNIYTIIYDNKQYQVSSLSKLESTIESISSGTTPKPKMMKIVYDLIQTKKDEIYQYVVKNYLSNVTKKHWNLKIQKDVSRIYLRFYVDLPNEEEREDIKDKLREYDAYRLDSVGTYIKNLIKKSGTDTSDFIFTRKFTDLEDKTGFVITIK